MKALQIDKPNSFRIVEIDYPRCGDDEIIVKLEFAAICNQNDYKIFYGLYGDLIKYPCDPGVYGHEGVGVIAEKGKNVSGFEAGDRVVMMLEGGPMLYTEYVLREADKVVKVSKDIPAEDVAVLELFGCAHHCCQVAGDISGKTVAVSGMGPAGLAILQLVKLKNPKKLYALDISRKRLEFAESFGVDCAVNVADKTPVQALSKENIELVIDATGVPEAILNAFEISSGEVVIFGFTNEKFEVDQSKWFQKELVIKNSKVQTIEDLKAVVGLLEKGEIETKRFVSDIMNFNDYADAVEKVYKKEAIKILLKW